MPKYRITRGTHRRADGTRAEAGTDDDIVELSDAEREALPANKFERIDEPESEVEATSTEADTDHDATDTSEPQDGDGGVSDTSQDVTVEADEEVTVESVIPDDYRELSSMAAEYEGSEVHGAMSGDDIREHFRTMTVPELQELKRKAEAAND